MAIKALLLRKKLEEMQARMAQLAQKTAELDTREAELTSAMDEAETEEQLRSVEELVETFTAEQRAHQEAVDSLQREIDTAQEDLRGLETKQPAPKPNTPPMADERKDDAHMNKRQLRAFGAMNMEQRAAFIKREDVQGFLTDFRTKFKSSQTRTVTGGELLIPEVVLDLIRQNIEDYSKLIRRVRLVPVAGQARQPIMGTIPEAVWTEACGALNERQFTLNQAEVDGYKVGGYVVVCNATLDDTDGALLSALILGLGAAIGIALDKAILFGLGVKMPLGIATRLAQKSQPDNYPKEARPWVDLSASNVITIPGGSDTGLKLFQQITLASGAAKGKYSRGEKFWAMNETTYTKIMAEAANFDSTGAIVSISNGTMPVVGGDLVVFSDDVMPNDTIIGGYGDLYLLAERAGTTVGYSDQPLYIQEQTVVKGNARYDGQPIIAEGFVAIGIGKAPVTTMSFAQDVANPVVAALQSLTIGGLSLSPAFSTGTDTYTADTTNAQDAISAVPTMGASVTVKVGKTQVQNGGNATWSEGSNVVTITVNNGENSKVYTVTVTKSGG
ncbi:phage major capsid protein [Dysosmobacter sp.]|jgi:HK97 family phage major capsid protein|uniref:phage major capsid protein n=1 Tax=Dysosmobacter sp. TaxID=2591382 RepID=UPI003D94BD4D